MQQPLYQRRIFVFYDTPLPLSSEFGTYKTVKAILWPWRSGESAHNFSVALSSLGCAVRVVHLGWSTCHAISGRAERASAVLSRRTMEALIRTCIRDKYSVSVNITTHLDQFSHYKTVSGTIWSNRWTYLAFSTNTHRDQHALFELTRTRALASSTACPLGSGFGLTGVPCS